MDWRKETLLAVENEDRCREVMCVCSGESRQAQEVEHLVSNAETAGHKGVGAVDPRIPGAEGTGASQEEEDK